MTVGQGHLYNNPAYSNWFALDAWVKEYGTMNGIALTDTIGTDVFLKDFRHTFATLFKGMEAALVLPKYSKLYGTLSNGNLNFLAKKSVMKRLA